MANLTTLRKDIQDYIYLRLGGDMIDVELDPLHYDMCIDKSLERYRQRAQSSVESSYVFLEIVEEQHKNNMVDATKPRSSGVRVNQNVGIASKPQNQAVTAWPNSWSGIPKTVR